jgi:isoquinoline 1-oxidoreductase alpha subunit
MKLTINGQAFDYTGDPEQPLLWYLRDEAGLTGTKYGCGIGQCGSCTVHVDGRARRACMTPMARLEGRSVVTIEGLSADGNHPVQRAWRDADVPQCGYCQAGQIMAAADWLNRVPAPTDDDIDRLQTNICRCGTYHRIRQAIKMAARDMSAGDGGQ